MGYKIGIIAGKGKIANIAVKEAKNLGYFTAVVGMKGLTNPKLMEMADTFLWVDLESVQQLIKFFKNAEIRDLILVGKIDHAMIYKNYIRKNETILNLLSNIVSKNPTSLFFVLDKYLSSFNFKIKSIKLLLKKYFPEEKILTSNELSKELIKDIKYGWKIAKKIASLDIGQTIVVKDRAVVAVEGMEGTDETIVRAGKLAGEGVVVIKVSRPKQDMRFDVPVVGLSTIKRIAQVKGKCLCLEAEKTVFLDQEKSISFAQENQISIVSMKQHFL